MAEVRVSSSADPAWEDMTVTTWLDDGSVGDTTTGDTSSVNDDAPNGCRYLYATAYLTAQNRLGTVHSVTGSTWAITLTATLEAI